ncbi:MAG: cupredoxin domain-containing protein [Candidatus Heimdallarchaeota archaeon]|nr:cupredoxin domain-containing protein [Candidatus Heimdallarchaeota archaeon]MBY8994708.1 cupredoxin domain-containing protein [Candidatus Heimdallarchaeota archaeon]
MKIRKLLWTITIISIIVLGNGLTTKAIPNQINDDISPDLFHIGTVYLSINVSATEFNPAEFTVKESTTVNLTITSDDIGHSFEIIEYGINETIIANSTVNIEFVADILGTFDYISVNSTATGTMTVEDPYVPDLPRPEDITVLFDLSHNSNTTDIAIKYSAIANWTDENDFTLIVNEGDFFTIDTLRHITVLMILEPDENLTGPELDVVKDYINNGRSLFIAGSAATAVTNFNEITKPFGYQFDNATARYINTTLPATDGENNTLSSFFSTDFLDHPLINENQYVPLTDEITSKILYTGTQLEYNASWITGFSEESNLTNSDEIIDSYQLFYGNNTIYSDENGDTIYWKNESIYHNTSTTLIAAVETAFDARMIVIGSAEILNNTMVGRYEINEIFFQRALQWVGKMYAVLRHDNYYVSLYEIKIGDMINTSVSFYAQNNTVLADLNVTLRVWRASQISQSQYMTQVNNSYYEDLVNTSNIKKGIVSINIVAHKRGYGFNITEDTYLQVNPAQAIPFPVPILYIITFVITIGIGVLALVLFFIRVIRTPKTEEEVVEVEEAEEDIDLDEYEENTEPEET